MRFFLTTGFAAASDVLDVQPRDVPLVRGRRVSNRGLYVVASVVLALLGCAIGMGAAGRVISMGRTGLSAD
jgi:hypothetical protein